MSALAKLVVNQPALYHQNRVDTGFRKLRPVLFMPRNRKWYRFQLTEMIVRIKSLPMRPCFKSHIEIVLFLPVTTIDKPCEIPIKSIPSDTWHRFTQTGGSV
jgi:hypothetical protein